MLDFEHWLVAIRTNQVTMMTMVPSQLTVMQAYTHVYGGIANDHTELQRQVSSNSCHPAIW